MTDVTPKTFIEEVAAKFDPSPYFDERTGALNEHGEVLVAQGLILLQESVFAMVESKGFHDSNRGFPEEIALMHSELSESLEAYRGGEPLVWFEHKDSDGVDYSLTDEPYYAGKIGKGQGSITELADAVIRVVDSAKGVTQTTHQPWTFAVALLYKLRYNATRPRMHGKIA